MSIDITFKKYKKGGLIEVYGDLNDAVEKMIEVLDSFKDSNKILAFRFMIDSNRGSREIVVWRGPGFSVIAHNCSGPREEVQIYKIFYEVFDVDKEGLEYDLTRLDINNINYVKSDKPVEELLRLVLLGSSSKGVTRETEWSEETVRTETRVMPREEGVREEERHRSGEVALEAGGGSGRGAMDVCLIALNKSVEKGCSLSSRDPLKALESCGVYFNMSGNSYLCILEDFDNCKYLVSIMDGSYTVVKCLSSREELEKLLGRGGEKGASRVVNRLREAGDSTEKRARPPLRA